MSSTWREGRHPVSIGHLVMGVALLGLVAIWAVVQTDAVSGEDIRWLLPVPWIAAGVAGLLATTVAPWRRHRAKVAAERRGATADRDVPSGPGDDDAAVLERTD